MDLLRDSVGRLYLKFLLPSLFSALVTTIYSFVDTIAIGQGVGTDGAAACAIIYPILGVASLFGFLCGIGGSLREVPRRGGGRKGQRLLHGLAGSGAPSHGDRMAAHRPLQGAGFYPVRRQRISYASGAGVRGLDHLGISGLHPVRLLFLHGAL